MKKLTRFLQFSLISFGILTGCGGSSGSSGPTTVITPPPLTELVWGQGNWDELNWQ